MDAAHTGAKISELRKALGLTQAELAERLHVTNKAVSKWECGKNYPDLVLLQPLAEALHCSVAELLGLAEPISEESIAVMSALSQLEKRSIRKSLYQYILLAMVTALVVLLSVYPGVAALRRLAITLCVFTLLQGAMLLEQLHKKFASPNDFQWPPDQDLIFLSSVKIQLQLWREKLLRK